MDPPERESIDHAAALGTRPIGRLLWQSCSQTTLSVGIFGVYALTNAWFVAHGVSAQAMGSVNLVAPLMLILGAASTSVGVGGASLVSRSLGAGDPASAARAAGNAFVAFWTTAIAFTIAGLLALDPLLTMLGATSDTRSAARAYAVVILGGAIFSTGFSSLVRAEGRMRFSTLLWVVPVLVQITLDPLLIFGLHLGVRGAALGTVGGQIVSASMGAWFFFLQRDRPYRIGRAALRPHGPTIRALFAVGAPSFLSGFGATLLLILVNTTLSRTGSVTALAAFALCARIQTFALMPHLGISQGLQPVVGYNAGRRRYDRVVRARNLSLRATAIYGGLIFLLVALLAEPLVGFFVHDQQIAATARHMLRIIAIGFAAAGIAPLVSAYFQSLGRPTPSYLISIGTLLAIKVPLVVALGPRGTTGVAVALAAGEVATAATALLILWRLKPPISVSGQLTEIST
jgi:putative MATE family efflux protein